MSDPTSSEVPDAALDQSIGSAASATAADTPVIRVFDSVGVFDGGQPVSIGGPKQRKLLALLAMRAGSIVSIDWLSEYLWDDDERPEVTAPTIRTYLSRLRTALPQAAQHWIETEPSGYRLKAPDHAVEHLRFLSLRAEATRARALDDPLTAASLLDQALGLWRGDPFRELEDVALAGPEIERLQLVRLEMLEERWDCELALGRHTQIVDELATFTAEHTLRERAVRQLALALHRSGRTTEALRVVALHRKVIADQSGLEPSAAVLELEQALLAGDGSLLMEQAGRPLRGYRLLEQAGAGAFSVVWRGIQPSVERPVAIKQIRAELATQPEFIRRFEAEAQLVARLEHPHIIPLIDFWRDPDSAYLVMRWLPGGSLEQRLDDGPLAVDAALAMVRQVGSALSLAHARGIVHRDVKAGNILFDDIGNAFLGDFGIALEAGRTAEAAAALSPGSPAYASPEQLRQEALGPAADVFSLGVVVFECLSGSLPFRDSRSAEHLVQRQLEEPYPLLSDFRTDLPSSVVDAVDRATAKSPADRFESVEDFVAALDPAAGAAHNMASTEPEPDVERSFVVNPYKGLRAFGYSDNNDFFGRDRLVHEMAVQLSTPTDDVASKAVIAVGPSGSGKSSVVRAGLVPALQAGVVDGSDDWFVTSMVPGANPFESLEAALLRIAVNPPDTLLDQLRDGRRGILRGVRRCLSSDSDVLLVIVDQMEELFTTAVEAEAFDFLDALGVAVSDPASPLRLVATLRADFYDRPLAHATFAPVLKSSAVDVTPLAPDELEQAIVEPARQVGVTFEPGLTARLVAGAAGQPAPLPMLQFVLGELFDRRKDSSLTLADYESLGGLSGALATSAEVLYDEASTAQRTAIRRVFGRMTSVDGTSADLRRRVHLDDLTGDPDAEWVIDRFTTARLLTLDRDAATREPTVEVAHEALLREWPRLAAWLLEDADLLRSAHAVGAAAQTWNAGGRADGDLYRGGRLERATELSNAAPERLRDVDLAFVDASMTAADAARGAERRRLRRLRRLVVGVGVALVVAVLAGSVAVVQRQRANDEADAARAAATEAAEQTDAALASAERADLATLVSRSAALTDENPEVAILLALEAHRRSPSPQTEGAVLNALSEGTLASRLSSLAPLNDLAPECEAAESVLRRHQGTMHTIADPAGTTQFGVADGRLVARDALSGAVTDHGPAPAPCVIWFASREFDRRMAMSLDGLDMWIGPFEGPWDVTRRLDEPMFVVNPSFSANRRLVLQTRLEPFEEFVIVDDRTGEAITPPDTTPERVATSVSSSDGSLIAVAHRVEESGVVQVLDENGTERFRLETGAGAVITAMAFDDAADELIAATIENTVLTIDLASGVVVAEVATPSTARNVAGVGLRDDGAIIVVSETQADVIDRRTGEALATLALPGVVSAHIREDGTVLAFRADRTSAVYDLGVSALVNRSWPVDPVTEIHINDGFAAVVPEPIGAPEIIDLSTGERETPELERPRGEPAEFFMALPDRDGFWALVGQDLYRYEESEIVEQLYLQTAPLTGSDIRDSWALLTGANQRGYESVELLDLGRDPARFTLLVPAPNATATSPSADGGLHIVQGNGTLNTYDADGVEIGEVSTGLVDVGVIALDPASGQLALSGRDGGVLLIDPMTGSSELLTGVGRVNGLGYARDGEILTIIGGDGTIRLWDVVLGESLGVVWKGSGGGGVAPWYDAAADSVWVASSGFLLEIPLDPARWIETACEVVGRDLTDDEWMRFVQADGAPVSACPQL